MEAEANDILLLPHPRSTLFLSWCNPKTRWAAA